MDAYLRPSISYRLTNDNQRKKDIGETWKIEKYN